MYPPKLDWEKVKNTIITKLREYFKENGFEKAVIGLSGGLDSSVTTIITTMAIGKENVHVYLMPTRVTRKESLEDAKNIIRIADIPDENWMMINIEPIINVIKNTLNIVDKKQLGNVMARVRMITLYQKAAENNALVVGTGDKSELLLGYFTKYGDGGVDILPLGDIYKTQLREFAKYLGIPEKIAYKPSSPELWPDHYAESELGLTYKEIDPILYLKYDLKLANEEVAETLGVDINIIERIEERCRINRHKLIPPPIIRIY